MPLPQHPPPIFLSSLLSPLASLQPRNGRRRPSALAYTALGLGVVCIAWSGLFVRLAAVHGVVAAFYRFTVAALILGPWWIVRQRSRPPVPARAVVLGCIAGACFAADNALFNIAVQQTSVAMATLLANTSPLFVAFGAWIAFRERPGRAFWIGLVLTLAGSAVVLQNALVGPVSTASARQGVSGDLLAILAAVFFAGYLFATRRARVTADTLTLTTIVVASGAILLLLACLILGEPLTGYRPTSWAALIALGLVSQVGGYLGVTYALGTVDATVTSVALLAQVPVTALLAAAVVRESLSPPQLAGGLLVLAGVYVVLRPPATQSPVESKRVGV